MSSPLSLPLTATTTEAPCAFASAMLRNMRCGGSAVWRLAKKPLAVCTSNGAASGLMARASMASSAAQCAHWGCGSTGLTTTGLEICDDTKPDACAIACASHPSRMWW